MKIWFQAFCLHIQHVPLRIGIEQGSDARRLDQLSQEIARLTREVADTRGEEASKRQGLEAIIARLEGQVSVDNSLIGALRDADADTVQAAAHQFGDVVGLCKLNPVDP